MTSVFYERFERHAHGEGLKGQSTHYCPGCGHGLAHKYLADAIDALGIQDRTVMVSPVGCAVFLYYYFDTGNTQAAHGRAPAVAIGHKVSNPDSIVVSYQGDGDLASIGLAEIISAAQLGLPLSIIFVNNAIYGMTGGQMAPTTLMGQKTATSPMGRNELMGQPLRMAEMMAGMDGPIYVERVALFDARQRMRAKKAIRKALQLQVEGKGFSFVEVLAECPTHLKMTPDESEAWVRDTMTQVFPLGVKKDVEDAKAWYHPPKPIFDPQLVMDAIGGKTGAAARFCDSFPSHIAPGDISLKLAGAGGDGAQTAAMLIAQAGINEGFDATHIPSYGPESRGGTSYADVHIAKDEVLAPSSPEPDILVAFNAPSLAKFGARVKPGGTIVYDSSVIADPQPPPAGVRQFGVPFTETAVGLGKTVVKNVVALGALQAATKVFPAETLLGVIRHALRDRPALIPLNEEAFRLGQQFVEKVSS
ncbi:MAG TPA: 2-oxoacid:acceptor oxidoreductase family protein [Thermoanaerobaculia bacterium]|nr:2-oxoacid:acceptor oxidoreductase family protein [Thermoanaerobaculia bacterium]